MAQPQTQPQTNDDALAAQFGAVDTTNQSQPPQTQTPEQGQGVDDDALAKQFGAVTVEPRVETDPRKTGELVNDVGNKVIVPKDGESFADTMKRAVQYHKSLTPQQQQAAIDKETATIPAKAAQTLGAAATIGVVGPAADMAVTTGAVEAGAYGWEHAPEIARAVLNHAKEPGTIIKLPFGRTIEYYLMAKMGLSKGAVAQIAKHLPLVE
jgi:hypothetical protein